MTLRPFDLFEKGRGGQEFLSNPPCPVKKSKRRWTVIQRRREAGIYAVSAHGASRALHFILGRAHPFEEARNRRAKPIGFGIQ